MSEYIRFEHIIKNFGEKKVLRDIDLSIEKGELVTLLGPSGCGKSTLLRILSGLEDATSGRIFLEGKDITDVAPQNRDIGMVFQHYSLFPNMNVRQNVAFGLKKKRVPKEEIDKTVSEMIEVVGLKDNVDQYPSQLSGGQQQRAALARALVTKPKVLLLDEPLSAIDALLRHSLQVEIRRIQKELNITAVFVTHDQEEAMVMSDRINLMHDGKIEQSARPIDLYTNPQSKFAATFIGHYNVLPAETFANAVSVTGATGISELQNYKTVAFRPEIVEISRQERGSVPADSYLLRGRVAMSLPHGNFLRYNISCGNATIDVDTLFNREKLFEDGTEVWLMVPKEECILF